MSADGNAPKQGPSETPNDDAAGARSAEDDLESLVSGLHEAAPDAAVETEDDLDLASLAGVASSRNLSTPGSMNAAEPEPDDRVNLAAAPAPSVRPAPTAKPDAPVPSPSPAATPAPAPAPALAEPAPQAQLSPSQAKPGMHWSVPLLGGLALGLGLAVVFTLKGREPTDVAAETRPVRVPTISVPLQAVAKAAPPSAVAAPAAELAHGTAPTAVPLAAVAEPPKLGADAQPAAPRPEPVDAPAVAPRPPVLAVRPSSPASTASRTEGAPTPVAPEADGDHKPGVEPTQAQAKAPELLPSQEQVDALLDEALSGKGKPQPQIIAEALPEAPGRDDVVAAMQVILPALRGCAMGQAGAASAGIVVRNDGRVASVEVAGAPFAGTASGRCMEGVIRRARFPRFRTPTFRVRFPFSIQ